MIQFLDDENLTDNERSDIDRILYHPKEISKCEFPEEIGYSFGDGTIKNVSCNSVVNSIDNTALPLSFEHQSNNHDNGNVAEQQQQQQHQQQISNMNMNPSTISIAAAYGGNTPGVQNYIQLSVPMTSQNYVAGQQPILSQAGTTYYQPTNYTSAGLRAYMPYTIIPAGFNFSNARFVLPQGHIPPQHYPAAVFYPTLIQQPPDTQQQPQPQTPPSGVDETNNVAAEDTTSTATYVTDGIKEIDNPSVASVDDNDRQMQAHADDRQPTQSFELRTTTTTNDNIVNSDFVNNNNNTNANSTNDKAPDVPIIDSSTCVNDVLPTSTTLSPNDFAHPNQQLIFESSSTNCQSDNATATAVDLVDKRGDNESDDKLNKMSITREQTGDAVGNEISNKAIVAGVVNGNEEIVDEKSQRPEGGIGVQASSSSSTNVDDDSATTATAAPAAAKSWASLFKNSAAANNAIVINKFGDEKITNDSPGDSATGGGVGATHSSAYYSNTGEINVTITTVERDPPAQKLGKELKSYRLQHRGPVFQLRGLNNCGNWCYVNATLQALMACPPFVHLLRKLTFMDRRTPSSTPMLDAFVKFVGEFPDRFTRKSSTQELDKGTSFEPKYIYSVLSSLKDDTSFKGRQEDAEEFLTLVLNHLHEEMAACLTYASDNNVQNGDALPVRSAAGVLSEDEWQQVLPGKKSAVTTRSAKLSPSPIVDIFSGVLRNAFQQHGSKESASSESFFTLQLSIQSPEIGSVSSALMHLGKEVMKNVTTPSKNTKVEVDITRRTTFQELPIVLILHLKHFVFVDDVVKKLIKPVAYGMDLQIDRNLAPPAAANAKFSRSYKLFAVVFHHGEQAAGGHYTADIFHGGHWVNMDDSKVEIVDENHVVSFQPPRVPYLLFYRRCDMFSETRQSGSGREYPPVWSSPPRGN